MGMARIPIQDVPPELAIIEAKFEDSGYTKDNATTDHIFFKSESITQVTFITPDYLPSPYEPADRGRINITAGTSEAQTMTTFLTNNRNNFTDNGHALALFYLDGMEINNKFNPTAWNTETHMEVRLSMELQSYNQMLDGFIVWNQIAQQFNCNQVSGELFGGRQYITTICKII